ncbi:unnamed protein product [Paramecium sonneborni]|uniref:Uncharacterized protein n=1 Tax=Paramecium sonneborni TaxID=65129 RepID=A0A8S1L2K2_9CILI|nr:unnamed protein product [Paramecium sonneborni]
MDKKYTKMQYEIYEEFKSKVQVGDFILTQTDSFLYSLARSVLKIEYDHLLVLIKDDQLLHIGWPKIRIINPLQILSQSSQYIIFRPQYQQGELQKFIMYLQTSLSADYDYQKLLKGMLKKLVNKIPTDPIPFQPNLRTSRVCTDLIFYWLEASSAQFRELLPNYLGYLDYPLIGSFTPDDINTLAKMNVFFKIIHQKKIQNPKNTFENLGIDYKNKSFTHQFLDEITSLKQLKKIIKLIPYPQSFIELSQSIIFIFQLYNLYNMPKKQIVRNLVKFVLKRYSKDELDEKNLKNIVNKVMVFVDITTLLVQPFSLRNYIKLIKGLVYFAFPQNKFIEDLIFQKIFSLVYKSKL